MKNLKLVLGVLALVTLLGVVISILTFSHSRQETGNEYQIKVVDAEGGIHQLDLRQGNWEVANTESFFYYVEVTDSDGNQIVGWADYPFYLYAGLYSQNHWENVDYLPSRIRLVGIEHTISDFENQMGRLAWQYRCFRVIQTWERHESEWGQSQYPDITSCNFYYPDPTLAALLNLSLPAAEDLNWNRTGIQVEPEILRLGDSGWSGEWKLSPTFFTYENGWYMAYWRFGACSVSIIGEDQYFEVPMADFYAQYQDRHGGEHFDVVLHRSWQSQYAVTEMSPLECFSSSWETIENGDEPLPALGS